MISCILLTAGESLRFGSPKALANIGSSKAIEHLQQTLIKSRVTETIVVTGAHENLIKPYVFNHSKVRLVHNKDYKLGQTSSFQTGVNIVDKNSLGFMLLPVDCPFITSSTINQMVTYFQEHIPEILIPTHQTKRGHPPIFHQELRKDILKLPTNIGLNSFMKQCKSKTIEINDPGIIQTFNTTQELEEIKKGHNT